MLMTGYLRNLGEQIRAMQRGLDDTENVAHYATMEPQVKDAPGAGALHAGRGAVVFSMLLVMVAADQLAERRLLPGLSRHGLRPS